MGEYCIKDGYIHRTSNQTLETREGDYWDPKRLLLDRATQRVVYQQGRDLVRRRGLKTVLDVGCGMAQKAVALLAPVADTVGVDQPTAVNAAQRMHGEAEGIRFVADDLEAPEQSELGTFDLVICADVIEHLLDPDVLLNYVRDRCHAGSYVLLSTPERDLVRGVANTRSPKAEHVREWNRSEFAAYLRSRGYEILSHELAPAFQMGASRYLLHERWRLFRKRIPLRHTQLVLCRPEQQSAA
jgi:SAM-dependent methyltransferase